MIQLIKNYLTWGRFGTMPREKVIKYLTSLSSWDSALMKHDTKTLRILAWVYKIHGNQDD